MNTREKAFAYCYTDAQAATSADGIIVATGLSASPDDRPQLIPMLDAVEKNTGERPALGLADKGYLTEEYLEKLHRRGQRCLVAVGREGKKPPKWRAGAATQRHHHRQSEEFYFVLEGRGTMEIDGEEREVGPGDAILIPPGAWHAIVAKEPLRFLCCCAPAYAHEDTCFE